MAQLLKGKEVAEALQEKDHKLIDKLKERGITPTLIVFKVGNKDSDLSYLKGINKKSEALGINVILKKYAEDVDPEILYEDLDEANEDVDIHGILIFRPLPKQFNDDELRNRIAVDKDVDGCSDLSLGSIFINKNQGYFPCTAQAVVEILDHYGIDISGRNITVIGRSLVIGKPLSMILLNRNATVTTCHSRSKDIPKISSKADILVCASGQMESISRDYVNEDMTIIDVGISWNEAKQKLCGDVLFEDVEPNVKAITPVPGGVGAVTTAVLLDHVVESAYRKSK
ncbi:MAG: bifunctional 5,10-methylene-tetrahydrofolate dehydrogenase/5,10-methylene-tetrahydrofolate cyclohydrolase [Erysipelotrichaceae bacterium]|nr:bifunctional 5,10-methylene-tetrahydrofolate dehydrogenase/5,10-methylene-tetrahydrofolate cyclohydrolase [Erysipelotrichaceae bacterium]